MKKAMISFHESSINETKYHCVPAEQFAGFSIDVPYDLKEVSVLETKLYISLKDGRKLKCADIKLDQPTLNKLTDGTTEANRVMFRLVTELAEIIMAGNHDVSIYREVGTSEEGGYPSPLFARCISFSARFKSITLRVDVDSSLGEVLE